MLQFFKKDEQIPPEQVKLTLRRIHAFVLTLLRSGGIDVGIIYYDDLLERFIFKYVVGDKMLKIVFDEKSMGLELYDYSKLETKVPHIFTVEDWNTVFTILNSAYNYLLSRMVDETQSFYQ